MPPRGHRPETDAADRFTGAWHHAPVTDQAERYDRIAEGYARWWAPVIAPSARGVLDRFDGALDGRPIRLLDVGSGTGTLSLAALQRWPDARVDAIDASREMVLATQAGAARHPGATKRFRAATAFADALPFPDDTFDAVVSSFVLQLVPNRFRALREIHRVLRPGGRLYSLDFDRQEAAWLRRIYLLYLDVVGASLGWVLHRNPDTYRYIPASIRRYPGARGVVQMMVSAGFTHAEHLPVLGGLMAIHDARR